MDEWTNILKDIVQNEDIKKGLGVTNVENKTRENYLRYFDHVNKD